MPTFLRKDAVRLFEASIQCLQLGIVGLGTPRLQPARHAAAQFAAEIGLIGSAAELAVSACYVQLAGAEAVKKSEGGFKSAREVIEEFLTLLASPTPQAAALTKGVADPDAHLAEIRTACRKFRLLATLRAVGLHNGESPMRDVCVSQARAVACFLDSLAKSERVRPYLARVPHPLDVTVEPAALVSELHKQLQRAGSLQQQANLLTQVFLVLPDVPEHEPDWLGAFDRVSVAPRRNDVAFLLQVLERAVPVTLRRSKHGGAPVSVVVNPADPHAVPIAPQYLRRAFTKRPDQFYADVAQANGRLEEGRLDLLPLPFVRELLVTGFVESEILTNGATLTAHEAWPLLATSLAAQGTPGPLWFVVRKTDDLGQLAAQMDRACKVPHPYLKARWASMSAGVAAIRHGKPLPNASAWTEILAHEEGALESRPALIRKVAASARNGRRLPPALEAAVCGITRDEATVGATLLAVLDKQAQVTEPAVVYWTRTLCETATEAEDLAGLVAVCEDGRCAAARTAARKAIRFIDFMEYGPNVTMS